jgi:four helix bundle protein
MEYPYRPLDVRLARFSTDLVQLAENTPRTFSGSRIFDQLVRSGTAIGANYEEASAAESKADFIHKMQIALKESRETYYWLTVAVQAGIGGEPACTLRQEAFEIRAMLSKAVATAKFRSR